MIRAAYLFVELLLLKNIFEIQNLSECPIFVLKEIRIDHCAGKTRGAIGACLPTPTFPPVRTFWAALPL